MRLLDKLPNDFYWGGSTSSFQCEGAWNIDGKGLSVYDKKEIYPGASDWKNAVDFYHHYKEDIDLLSELGFNMYRLQFSWSRIFPDGTRTSLNEKGVQFYDNVINYMLEKGIEPMVCLYHFDMPLALAEKYNGWASREVIDLFVDYVDFVINHFKGRIKYYITFNEQNLFLWKIKVCGGQVPEGQNPQEFLFQGAHNSYIAHARCVQLMKAIDPNIQVGGMVAYNSFYPATSDPKDVKFAQDLEYMYDLFTFDIFVKGEYSHFMLNYFKKNGYKIEITEEDKKLLKNIKNDFLAFSYYASRTVKYIDIDTNKFFFGQNYLVKNPYLETTEVWNWDIDPLGLRMIMDKVYNRYNIPLFILENGIGLVEELDENGEVHDTKRIEYHRSHINAMKDAILEDEIPCKGYLTWGPIDILSSNGEMKKRYGFVFVNRDENDLRDMRRVKKESFEWMKNVCKTNGEDLR